NLQKSSCSLTPQPLFPEFLPQDAAARRASAPAAPAGPLLSMRLDAEAPPVTVPTAPVSLTNASVKWTEYTRPGISNQWPEGLTRPNSHPMTLSNLCSSM
ncbi:hypothetical protein K443DRAFT_91601, partial [Laccaria amethystina LaAM-08-1]